MSPEPSTMSKRHARDSPFTFDAVNPAVSRVSLCTSTSVGHRNTRSAAVEEATAALLDGTADGEVESATDDVAATVAPAATRDTAAGEAVPATVLQPARTTDATTRDAAPAQ